MPQACIETILVPIYKNNKSNTHDKNNYRPIALATVISKLLEHFILQQISSFITTSNNQFGFSANIVQTNVFSCINRLFLTMLTKTAPYSIHS